MNKLIILDRDGVINQDSDNFIKSVDQFRPIPGSLNAIARLYQAGYRIMVATNQSGIFRGLFSLNELTAMHTKLQHLLSPLNARIEHFYFCPHGPDEQCDCRKPKPGMFKQIARDFFSLSDDNSIRQKLANVYTVGDSLRDLQAGRAAGCKIALVKTGKGLRTLKQINQNHLNEYSQLPIYTDLADFTDHLLNQSNS